MPPWIQPIETLSPEAAPVSPAPWGLCRARGEALLQAGASGGVWRITQGVFVLQHPDRVTDRVTQLAFAGDRVGLEALYGEPYACTVTALLDDSRALPESPSGSSTGTALHRAALRQQQRQMLNMSLLRSGPVVERLRHLLGLLTPSGTPTDRRALPALKDMALIVDSAPETVCRELSRLVPARTRKAAASGATSHPGSGQAPVRARKAAKVDAPMLAFA